MIDFVRLKRLIQQRQRGSGEEYDFIFWTSVNDVISDLNDITVLEVDAIDEEDPPESLDLDAKYSRVFTAGVWYYMQRNATWAQSDKQVSDIDYRRAMAVAQGQAIEDAELTVGLEDYGEE